MKWARQQRIAHAGLKYLVATLAATVDQQGLTWQAQATIADEMAVSLRCVRYWLDALEKLGVIQRAHRSNGRGGRGSDVIRLSLGRQFTVTAETAAAVLQAARGAGRKQSSKRHHAHFQPAPGADDQVRDQLRVEDSTQQGSPDYQSAEDRGRKPTLLVVNGGRA